MTKIQTFTELTARNRGLDIVPIKDETSAIGSWATTVTTRLIKMILKALFFMLLPLCWSLCPSPGRWRFRAVRTETQSPCTSEVYTWGMSQDGWLQSTVPGRYSSGHRNYPGNRKRQRQRCSCQTMRHGVRGVFPGWSCGRIVDGADANFLPTDKYSINWAVKHILHCGCVQ